jgi:hypothetical protein
MPVAVALLSRHRHPGRRSGDACDHTAKHAAAVEPSRSSRWSRRRSHQLPMDSSIQRVRTDRRIRRATAGWPRRPGANHPTDFGGTPRRAIHSADVAKGDHDTKRRTALAADLAPHRPSRYPPCPRSPANAATTGLRSATPAGGSRCSIWVGATATVGVAEAEPAPMCRTTCRLPKGIRYLTLVVVQDTLIHGWPTGQVQSQVACQGDTGCVLASERRVNVLPTVLRRRYGWRVIASFSQSTARAENRQPNRREAWKRHVNGVTLNARCLARTLPKQ